MCLFIFDSMKYHFLIDIGYLYLLNSLSDQRCADSFQEKHLEARLNILNLSPIFLDRIWTKKELKSIASPLETLEFSTDQTICQQGRFATHLYFVVRGECNAFKTLHHYNPNSSSTASSMKYHNPPQSNSYTMSLGRLSKGDCFGLQSCGGSTYAENMKYNVSVIATTPMAVFSLTRFDVFNRIDANIRIELQKKCETHLWNDNINLTRRLVNRNRFQIYLKNNERNVLPIKYLNRKTKNRKSSTNASLKSSYSTSLLPKLKNNSNLLSSSIELRPPPSRQCSRKAIHIAAAKQQSSKSSPPRITSLSSTGNHNSELSVDGNDTTMINSMVDWDDVQGTRANGLLPNIKPLKLPHNVIIHKIEMWSKKLTGAKINTFNIKEYDGTYDIKNGDDHEILVEEEQGEEE
jgi:CRP-like cAMP-binding protein